MRYIARTLLSNGSSTGSAVSWPGWRGTFIVEATTWSSTTAKLQYKSPNGTWIDVDATNAALTANGMVGFECPPGEIRVSLSGTPTAMYAYAITNDENA